MNKVVYCPVNGWNCPYYDANGCCMMYPDGDPLKECDDFATFWNEGDDYVVDLDDNEDEEPADIDNDCGYDPYLGCFTDDC